MSNTLLRLAALVAALSALTARVSCAAEEEPYRLRPGDVINVTVVPQSSYGHVVTVQPDGKVNYPVAGEIQAAGKTLEELRVSLTRGLEKELNAPRVTVTLQTSAPERLPQITVLGAVRAPGLFDLKKDWRVTEALAAAGGPAPNADLKRITITHKDRTIQTVDLAVGGDEASQKNNILIRGGDLIVVIEGDAPPRAQVTVLGAVKAPGIFDFRTGWRLSEAVASAGGPTPEADLTRVTITHPNRTVETADLTLNPDGTQKQNVLLQPGDLILVVEGERKRPTATVVGEVVRPGSFELQPNMSLLEALTLCGGPTPKANLRRATLSRAGGGLPVSVDLQALLSGSDPGKNLKLSAGDTLIVPENRQRAVVIGEVARQGEIALEGGETVLDLLLKTGGANSSADLHKATILRRNKDNKPVTIPVDLKKLATRGSADVPQVESGDLLFIPPRNQKQKTSWQQYLSPLGLIFGLFGGV